MEKKKSIDRAVVDHLATLASISLRADEAERMVTELDAIVAYVEEIRAVDTAAVKGDASPSPAPWREDLVVPGLSHEDALHQAPGATEDGFAVPTFVIASSGTRPR
jgi:aspartyl-tRNA(Asn)/glutamyl-tRNA(Gln) amidotransferase subunit C